MEAKVPRAIVLVQKAGHTSDRQVSRGEPGKNLVPDVVDFVLRYLAAPAP